MDQELIEIHIYNKNHIPKLRKDFPLRCQRCKNGNNYMTEEDRIANKEW